MVQIRILGWAFLSYRAWLTFDESNLSRVFHRLFLRITLSIAEGLIPGELIHRILDKCTSGDNQPFFDHARFGSS